MARKSKTVVTKQLGSGGGRAQIPLPISDENELRARVEERGDDDARSRD